MIALGTYPVHTSQTIVAAQPRVAAANVELVYLARYCPEQSGIAWLWRIVRRAITHNHHREEFAVLFDDLKPAVPGLARPAGQPDNSRAVCEPIGGIYCD